MTLTTVNPALLDTQAQYTGFKNRIINGAMVIDQRNAGASVTPTADGTYTLDRWSARLSVASKYSVQQVSTAPTGFVNSLKVTSLSAYTVGASEFFSIVQNIEGFNTADFMWGTANAATITVSFQVYSSLTGTFGGAIRNYDGSRSYPFTYTISAANTWTSISLTIAGDTSGTWVTTNSGSLQVIFNLGAGATVSGTAGAWSATGFRSATGAVSVVGTNGATFYITGVQLEKGSTATSFDYRPYGTELMLCQRYFTLASGLSGFYYSTNGNAYFNVQCTMRATPSAAIQGTITLDAAFGNLGAPTSGVTVAGGNQYGVEINFAFTNSGTTNGQVFSFRASNSSSGLALSSEL